MKKIEPAKPAVTDTSTLEIKEFWERNVNSEVLFGHRVTQHDRGEDGYFADLEQQRYRSHTHIIPWIKSMKPGKTVLEIGCGIGMDAYQMAKHGLDVTAIDLTGVAIQTAQSRFLKNGMKATFKVCDATSLDFDDNSFDYVYSFGVLHHTKDTEKSIDEVHRVLKPGGIAKLMLYNRHSLNEIVHRAVRVPFEAKDEMCPVVRRFTKSEVLAMCSHFKNTVVKKEYIYGEGYGVIYKLTPKAVYQTLSKHAGWHLMIEATK